jgi:1-acyl-sn-glycerol-3-phosphate acyltransferase
VSLAVVPCTLSDACAFVGQHHRHHKPPQGGLFAVAVADGDAVVGVAIVGRPVAGNRMKAEERGWVAEITRVATDGTPNACSMLYAACRKACLALGYRKVITYTLQSEPGTSLRAAGWRVVAEVTGKTWNTTRRPRVDKHPLQDKFRWEAA